MFYTLENSFIKAVVSDLGATLVSFVDKKTNKDLVLGFDSEKDYRKNYSACIGATIGRNANRIADAKFSLNGKQYQLARNSGKNNLHGGYYRGFAFRRWRATKLNNTSIIFHYISKDGEQGFPSRLDAIVKYELNDNNLAWIYSGITDEDTILNMTNHSYFNLGEENIYDLDLKIYSNLYAPTDSYGLTLDKVNKVHDKYDFTEFKKLRYAIDEQGHGIDNNYVWENLEDKLVAELKSKDVHLKVSTNLPDMHLYTAEFLSTDAGKNGKTYGAYDGVCLECQYFPNAINYDSYIKPILKSTDIRKHYINYEIV